MRFYQIFAVMNIAAFILLGLNFRVMFHEILHEHRILFWIGMFLFTQCYWIVRRIYYNLDREIPGALFFIISVMLGLFLISLFTAICVDIIFVITKIIPPLNFVYLFLRSHLPEVGIAVILLTFLQFGVGFYLGNTFRTSYYVLDNPLIGEHGKRVRIVHLSDLHVSSFTSVKQMRILVKKVNGLHPDMVVIVGDMIDSSLSPYLKKNLKEIFCGLGAKYGVYAVLGNHEYYGGDLEGTIAAFRDSGITVLRDEAIDIDNIRLTVVGRDDYASEHFTGKPRLRLREILQDHHKKYPVLVLNHQPRDAEESIAHKVFLELSGHTHNGQILPINFLMRFIYPIGWGLWAEGDYALIVSSGAGTWGPPVRTTSYAEIVVVDINP